MLYCKDNATSMQIVSLKIVQCDTTFKALNRGGGGGGEGVIRLGKGKVGKTLYK